MRRSETNSSTGNHGVFVAVLKSREGMETVTQELARLSPEITASIAKMRQVAYTSG